MKILISPNAGETACPVVNVVRLTSESAE